MPASTALKQLSIRISKKLAQKVGTDRGEAWREDRHGAIIAVGRPRAAGIARLSLWEFTESVKQRGTRWDSSGEEAKQELQRILSEA